MRKGNGDGTVPLISLGVHCRGGWRTRKLNPGRIEIKTRELVHRPVPMYQDPRWPSSSTLNSSVCSRVLTLRNGRWGTLLVEFVQTLHNGALGWINVCSAGAGGVVHPWCQPPAALSLTASQCAAASQSAVHTLGAAVWNSS